MNQRYNISSLIMLIALLISIQSVYPQSKERISKAKSLSKKVFSDYKLSALSIGFIRNGRIVMSEHYGYADIENRVKADSNTRYRIGSISKAITSVMVGKLFRDSLLMPESTVAKYLDYFPKQGRNITVRHLLSHQSGIRHYRDLDSGTKSELYSKKKYNFIKDAVAVFADSPLKFKPGTRTLYSTYGFTLLSAVIESAVQREFNALLRDSLFAPFKLNSICPDRQDSVIQGRAKFYSRENGKIVNAPYVDNSNKWAGGGYIAKLNDLLRFADRFNRLRYFGKTTFDQLTTPQRLRSGKITNIALGWFVGTDPNLQPIIYHYGNSIGARAYLIIWHNRKSALVALTNCDTDIQEFPLFEIAEILMGN